MIKVLVDTNVILDIGLKREPHFHESAGFFKAIDGENVRGYVTASTITDIYYISKKEKGHATAIAFIQNLIQLLDVVGVDKEIVMAALNAEGSDFEDAIQISSAEANDIGTIVTHNTKDFLFSSLKILTPGAFLKELKGES